MAESTFASNAIILPGQPVCNRIIHIEIDGLLAADGSELNGMIESHYTTCFNPFYSNAMRVRLIAGEFLNDVPDDTINQLVWYFSRQADLMNYRPDRSALNPDSYNNYRSRWVSAATTVALISGTSINGDLQKRLGDLSIARSAAAQELLNYLRDELMHLTHLLEDGGNYGRNMKTVSKASGHPDAPILGRLFMREDMHDNPHRRPGANKRAPFSRRSDGKQLSRWKKTWGGT